jgi:hypothetical protein
VQFAGCERSGRADAAWWEGKERDPGAFVPGFAGTLGGESIRYRSLSPNVTEALLVRAQEGKRIQWETQPVPTGAGENPVVFVWMTGMASMRGAHTFTLRVNGEPWFTFTTSLDGSETYWKRIGAHGAELVFQAQVRDEYNDLFGHMYLRVPPHTVPDGAPVRLEVEGDRAGSADWYMTFKHAVQPRVRALQQFEWVSDAARTRQLVKVEMEHCAPPEDAVVRIGADDTLHVRLIPGVNLVYLPFDTVSSVKYMSVTVQSVSRQDTTTCELKPFSTFGYVPADREGESVSKTLEYAYDDWCIAQMARLLNRPEIIMLREGTGIIGICSTVTGFMRGGTWLLDDCSALFSAQTWNTGQMRGFHLVRPMMWTVWWRSEEGAGSQ